MASLMAYMSSPREASQIFNLDGSSPPRAKSLFFVRFTRANSTTAVTSTQSATSGTNATWLKDLSFVVKSVDRPAQQPQVDEIKQYNKIRVVHTGIKYSPVRMSIYDTADSLAHQMWSDYSRHYFGAYRHDQSPNDFRYDVTTPQFNDTNNQGFGFAPFAETSGEMDDNTQFYFDRVSVYQVYGGEYVQFDLVNPKISSFDPDELSYEDNNFGVINLTFTYEAVIYANQGKPQAISGASGLADLFADPRMDPGVVDYDDEGAFDITSPVAASILGSSLITALTTGAVDSGATVAELTDFTSSLSGGALAAYGLYNFGSVSSVPTTYNTASSSSDLLRAALANPALAAALAISTSQVLAPQISTLTAPYAQTGTLSGAAYDVAASALGATGGGRDRVAGKAITDETVAAMMAAGAAAGSTAREQIYPLGRTSPPDTMSSEAKATFERLARECAELGVTLVNNAGTSLDAAQSPNTWNSAGSTGAILSPRAYAILNARRTPGSQIGYNVQNTAKK